MQPKKSSCLKLGASAIHFAFHPFQKIGLGLTTLQDFTSKADMLKSAVEESIVIMEDSMRDSSLEMAKLAESWDKGLEPPQLIESSSDSRDESSEEDPPNAIYVDCFQSKLQAKAKTEALLVGPVAFNLLGLRIDLNDQVWISQSLIDQRSSHTAKRITAEVVVHISILWCNVDCFIDAKEANRAPPPHTTTTHTDTIL